MTLSAQLELDHERCREITETCGPNFSVGFRFLPTEKRRAVQAAYAFCRLADDIADEDCQDDPRCALVIWEQELDRVYAGRPLHPVGRALADVLERFAVPRRAFADLILGCRHDLEGRRYQTYEDLLGYCELVAATIGRISLSIFGVLDPRAHEHGHQLATALQLTNILRDVREDALRGRLYLPVRELEESGIRPDDLAAGNGRSGFAQLMTRTVRRAAHLYRQAERVVTLIEDDSRTATRLMGSVYVEVLRRIAAEPGRVLRERVQLTDDEKATLVRQHLLGTPSSWEVVV